MDKTYMDVEDLEVYQRLYKLQIEAVTRNLSHAKRPGEIDGETLAGVRA